MYGCWSFIWRFLSLNVAYGLVALIALLISPAYAMPANTYNSVVAYCGQVADKSFYRYASTTTALEVQNATNLYTSPTYCDPTEPTSKTSWCRVRKVYCGADSLNSGTEKCYNTHTIGGVKYGLYFESGVCAQVTSTPSTGCSSPDNAGICDYIGSVQQIAARAESVATTASNELTSVNSSLWGYDMGGEYLSAGDRLGRLNDWTRWGVEEGISTRNTLSGILNQSLGASSTTNNLLTDILNKPAPTVTVDTAALETAQAATTSAVGTSNSRLTTISSALTSNNTKTDATNTKLDSVNTALVAANAKNDLTNTKLDSTQTKIDATTTAVNNANTVLNTSITSGNASIRDKVIEGNSELVTIKNFESALNDKVSTLNDNTDGLEVALNGLGVDQRQTTQAVQNAAEYVASAINNKVIPPSPAPDMTATNNAIAAGAASTASAINAASSSEVAASDRMTSAVQGLRDKMQATQDFFGNSSDDFSMGAGAAAGAAAGSGISGETLTSKLVNLASLDQAGFLGARVTVLPSIHLAVPLGDSSWSTDIDFSKIEDILRLMRLLMWVSVWFMVLRIILGRTV